ncbi:MAG: RICIN domain-containing protein [Deltaproteobacteria bacterium]|nr:RICIN domain-containing protein [Deltaproteobacteria bacterium]
MPATISRSPRRYPQIVLFVSVGCVALSCSSSVSEPNEIEAETASEANALGNNIRFFGYYQADQPQELDVVAAHSTTLIMEGAISDERFNQMRQHGVKVFLSLASVFFEWDASCPCQVFQDTNAESRWSSVRDVITRNRDVIEAFIPIDEPEFSRFPGTDAAQPMRRRDGLERIAAIVRRDIPGAKMAVNFWGDTVRGFTRNAYDFQRRYPPSYDFVGTESYETVFDEVLYQSLLNLTASVKTPAPEVYLVPKAFINVGNGRFPQPDGESGVVNNHLERAIAFANRQPRVVGLFAFLYRTIGEAGGQLTGVNEHPAILDWMRRTGQTIRGGSGGSSGGGSPGDGSSGGGSSGGGPGGAIRNANGKCVDVHAGCMNSNGCNVQVWDCNSAPQTWTLANGQVRNASGKCLDVHAGCMNTNGCNVQVWDCNSAPQQTWTSANGQIRNANGKCLDVHAGCMNANGCNIQVWDCNNAPQQTWSADSGTGSGTGSGTTPTAPPISPPASTTRFTSSAASTQLWPVSGLHDGNPASCYSSRLSDLSNGTREWIAAWLPGRTQVSGLTLRPRYVGTARIAFPPAFRVYVTNESNTAWALVGDFSETLLPSTNGDLTLSFPRTYTTYGVHIVPTRLGPDDFGNAYLQLCELTAH